MTSILQQLYDSEINFQMATFWDGGFDVKLGDTQNGFKASASVHSFDEAVVWLAAQAISHFPESEFAKRNAQSQ